MLQQQSAYQSIEPYRSEQPRRSAQSEQSEQPDPAGQAHDGRGTGAIVDIINGLNKKQIQAGAESLSAALFSDASGNLLIADGETAGDTVQGMTLELSAVYNGVTYSSNPGSGESDLRELIIALGYPVDPTAPDGLMARFPVQLKG